MKINNDNSLISFRKSLVATCKVKSADNLSHNCNIFALDESADIDYFDKTLQKEEWTNAKFMKAMSQIMHSPFLSKSARAYTLENQNGDCLGYIATLILNTSRNKENIQYLEVCPTLAFANKDRNLKYIGQSLVSFLIAQSRAEGKNKVCVPVYSTSARDFYMQKCGFDYDIDREDGFVVERENFSRVLDKYKDKTGSEINLVL